MSSHDTHTRHTSEHFHQQMVQVFTSGPHTLSLNQETTSVHVVINNYEEVENSCIAVV